MKLISLSARGFTLVEVIIVMVITGIIGGIIAIFIRVPVQNYVDMAGRAELTDVADTAVRRMSREIRLAVPNSIRQIGSQGIEFVPTKAGGRYLAAEDAASAGEPHLSFTTSSTAFTVVGFMPTGRQTIVPGDNIVVFNEGEGSVSADVWSGGNRALVQSVSGNVVTLAANPYATQTPPMPHPLNRFLVTPGPVRYVCQGANLLRYERYAFGTGTAATPATTPAVLAGNVRSCLFEVSAAPNTRTSVVTLTLALERTGTTGAESVELFQQVHVDNTP